MASHRPGRCGSFGLSFRLRSVESIQDSCYFTGFRQIDFGLHVASHAHVVVDQESTMQSEVKWIDPATDRIRVAVQFHDIVGQEPEVLI